MVIVMTLLEWVCINHSSNYKEYITKWTISTCGDIDILCNNDIIELSAPIGLNFRTINRFMEGLFEAI